MDKVFNPISHGNPVIELRTNASKKGCGMCLDGDTTSLRSKRSRTTQTKFGPRERGFRIRAARKMEREQKGGRSGVGGGERR